MKKFLKKIGAVVLCICMLIPMIPEVTLADGTDIQIDQIEINLQAPLVGTGEQKVQVEVENAATYMIALTDENLYWKDGSVFSNASEFNEGDVYVALIKVEAKDGYSFIEAPVVSIENVTEEIRVIDQGNANTTGGYDYIVLEVKMSPQTATLISNIDLVNVPTGEIGTVAKKYWVDEAEYSVEGIWEKYDYAQNTYVQMTETEMFAQGGVYRLCLTGRLKQGYQLCVDTVVTINGKQQYSVAGLYNGSFEFYHDAYVAYNTVISEVVIPEENFPVAAVGQTFTDTSFEIPVAADAPYKVMAHWTYQGENGYLCNEGTFQAGEEYYLQLHIIPKEGYCFDSENGVLVSYGTGTHEPYFSNSATAFSFEKRVSFKTQIDRVTLLNLPTAEVGKTVQQGVFSVEVPTDANYTATGCWYQGYELVSSDVFEANKTYQLHVYISPKDGYEFLEHIYVNAYGIEHMEHAGVDNATFVREFSFLQKVEVIELLGYKEPQVGEKIADNLAGLKVPEGANYKIEFVDWGDIEYGTGKLDVFKAGHGYDLMCILVPCEGYEFIDNTGVLINGQKDSSLFVNRYEDRIEIYKHANLRTLITEVQLFDLPTMEIGKQAVSKVSIPEGANYDVDVFWNVWDEKSKDYLLFDGIFEAGKVYELVINISPKTGFSFSEADTKLIVNGMPVDEMYIDNNSIGYFEKYSIGQKLIERIELVIAEPVIGAHASISPVITIVGDANYIINEAYSGNWLVQTTEGNCILYDDYFVSGYVYGVSFELQAKEGYVFADDVVIVINGKVIPKDAIYNSRLKSMYIDYVFGTGTEEVKETQPETTPKTSPKTSDASMLGFYMIISFIGIILCANRVKTRMYR